MTRYYSIKVCDELVGTYTNGQVTLNYAFALAEDLSEVTDNPMELVTVNGKPLTYWDK